jgi:hypothetical protein
MVPYYPAMACISLLQRGQKGRWKATSGRLFGPRNDANLSVSNRQSGRVHGCRGGDASTSLACFLLSSETNNLYPSQPT